jgi:hypothetical protein
MNPNDVIVQHDAELNARCQFGLNTKADLLAFISNGGLQALSFIISEPWRNNPKKDIMEIFIDSYHFRTNQKIGYIAFMKGYSGKYIIKSFHLDHRKMTLKDVGNNPLKSLR